MKDEETAAWMIPLCFKSPQGDFAVLGNVKVIPEGKI